MSINFENDFELKNPNLRLLKIIKPYVEYQQTLKDSSLLTFRFRDMLKKWLCKDALELDLLYKASRDTFDLKVFHQRCDNQGKTILVIKSQKNHIFGAYIDVPLNSLGYWIQGSGRTFLFSFNHMTKHHCLRHLTEVLSNSQRLQFGFQNDLVLVNHANTELS